MKKIAKLILYGLFGLIVLLVASAGLFIYKVKNGFPVSYETEHPTIHFPANQPAVLLFSKTTGYRHGESIDASKPVFRQLAKRNGWFVYETEEGGVFNPDQLKQFRAVVFNNSTGRVLNDEQQQALSQYVEAGGALLGIHGSGDDSHHWPWYENNLLGAQFSHHPLNPQLQPATVQVDTTADSTLTRQLPPAWTHTDEWYVFFSQPQGVQVVSYIDGDKIVANGNVLFVTDKNFGMGSYHPVAWYRIVGQGKTFYTSMGHHAPVWQNAQFVRLLENALRWAID
ncbi:hypothetical protein GGR92_004115 [Spirosoma lacussanchae]|uniref:ThuA domain-containing protein n=1 Tax=Spirosoma lacussanchae TaxID=1884249 RepID=UPI001109430E|nr:ThuA domain-containing protein [Spirosoma lacussanchae]